MDKEIKVARIGKVDKKVKSKYELALSSTGRKVIYFDDLYHFACTDEEIREIWTDDKNLVMMLYENNFIIVFVTENFSDSKKTVNLNFWSKWEKSFCHKAAKIDLENRAICIQQENDNSLYSEVKDGIIRTNKEGFYFISKNEKAKRMH